ncbi:MAG: M48 family metallopeptidase [Sphingomicrobium sp.]
MPATWNGILSTGRSEPLSIPGLAWPVEIRPHPHARSLRLRLDEARGLLTLTCPRRVSRRTALDWAQRQSGWVEAQLARIAAGEPFLPGGLIPFKGSQLRLQWAESMPRTPRLAGDLLICGGPAAAFPGRIERFLRLQARAELSAETADAAERAGVSVRSVSVGDATSRWGSCSASGAIRYSWRLILAPPHLLRWVVAHEVAHRRHMDHGPSFKALEAELYGGNVAAARAELRALGPRLKRVGRPV